MQKTAKSKRVDNIVSTVIWSIGGAVVLGPVAGGTAGIMNKVIPALHFDTTHAILYAGLIGAVAAGRMAYAQITNESKRKAEVEALNNLLRN